MPNKVKVLVTGASGFVGSALAQTLDESGYDVVALSRRPVSPPVETIRIGSLLDLQPLEGRLQEVEVVVHCAARVHVMHDSSTDPLAAFRSINVGATADLARRAAREGVRRFIYISSVKVNGESTNGRAPFSAEDAPAPRDPYGQSKMEAEQALQQIAAETDLEVTIIRPPLVYGPGVKGNFAAMARLVQNGIPLPLGAVHNKRSLVGLDNLVDLIVTAMVHPAAANQIFMAADACDLSTTELLKGVGQALGKPARLVPVPAGLLSLGATVLGKREIAGRLLGSLQVDISKIQNVLGWHPPLSTAEGLKRCFIGEKNS